MARKQAAKAQFEVDRDRTGMQDIGQLVARRKFVEIGRRLLVEGNCELLVVGGLGGVRTWQRDGFDLGCSELTRPVYSQFKSQRTCYHYATFMWGLITGTTHLAAAVGTRCFAIYGERNNPGLWIPNGRGHRIIYHEVECAGCRLFECPLQEHPCMKNISIEAVWNQLREFVQVDYGESDTSAIAV